MKPEIKKQHIALPAALAACPSLLLAVCGVYFARYLRQQIYEERTDRLVEITSQVQANLNNALNTHWVYLTAAVNLLEEQEPDTIQEATAYISGLERLLETELYSSRLILLDSQGNCYDDTGDRGVWSDVSVLASGEDRYTFISESPIYQGSYWNFVQKLNAPIHTREDGVSFTHVVLLKDMRTLTGYYDSSAYGDQNETYILKGNGTRMNEGLSQEKMIRSYNVLKVLEGMEGQRYPDIRAALEQTDTLSSDFIHNGVEYYYCVTALRSYDTLLLSLIPAQFVATETVKMVSAVIQTLLALAAILLVLLVLTVTAVLRHRSSARMVLQEQANLRRQEEMNARLEESNTLLAQSKEAAEQALQIAESANRAKSAFLGSVSHDIRTPMNAIIRPQAKAKDQTFDIRVTPLKYERVQGDKLRINQILINLLSNSVKYTPAEGRIEFRVEELPQVMKVYSRVRFTVSDNGMGMSEEYQKAIFDPFTREETKATYGIQGTGLGMAITKSLVDLMGGSIKVTSKLDQEKYSNEIPILLLTAYDWSDIEQEAVEAFERSQPGDYDLILMDVQMPVMDGYTATRAIRASQHPSASQSHPHHRYDCQRLRGRCARCHRVRHGRPHRQASPDRQPEIHYPAGAGQPLGAVGGAG